MLSAMAPHGREMSQDLRKKISLHKKGEGYKKISKALLISQNTVAKVVQTFKKDGTATISQRRPGRPRKSTPRQERLLMRRVEENRHASSLQLSKEVESQTGVTISPISWSESNRTPMGNSEETSWASLSIQHPISKRGHSWRMEKDRSGKMSPTCSFHA